MKKSDDNYRSVPFVPVCNGALAFFHRPSKAGLGILKESGCTCVVTLQSESEQAVEIKEFCKKLALKHVWVPLQGANKRLLESNKTSQLLREALIEVHDLLNLGHFVLVHCAAGIHRTGIFSYALLRLSGQDESATLETIKQVRLVTYERCGKFRFELAENLAQQILNEMKHFEVPELASMRSTKTIENPLVFVKFTPTHLEMLRFDCVVVENDLQSYVLGPSADLTLGFQELKEKLGNQWLSMRETKYLNGGIRKSLKNLVSTLKLLFKQVFDNKIVTWAGPLVQFDFLFLSKFCPELVDVVGERTLQTADYPRDTIFEEILEFRQSALADLEKFN